MCFHGRLFPEAEAFVLTLFAMLPYDSLPARTLISRNECGGFGRMRMERDERIYGYGTDDTQ